MNVESHVLLDDVVRQVQEALRKGDQPALAVLEGESARTLSSSAYLRDPVKVQEFERRVAREADTVGLDRLVLAVPMISTQVPLTDSDDAIRVRSPYAGPLRDDDDERHVIVWMAYDTEDGVEYGMVPYTRARDGTPAFGDPDRFVSIPLNPGPGLPGVVLLGELLDENLQRRKPR